MALTNKRFAFIGVGNMGLAIIRGLLDSDSVEPANIRAAGRRPARCAELAKQYGFTPTTSNVECAREADVVLLAVKPQIFGDVLEELSALEHHPLFLSVAAGVTTARIEKALGGHARVVRAMPNTPSTIKQGATALAAGRHSTDADLALADALFGQIGLTRTVDEEHLDAVTGLSGSGPAFTFLIIDAFADAGVKVGLSREVAMALAVQTIQGAARLLQETGEHPGRLKDQVTSPGGTAIAGLHTLEEGGLRTTIMNAVESAARRARELGQSDE